MKKNKTKHILFDFDGVIADTFQLGYRTILTINPTLTEAKYRTAFEGNIYANTTPAELKFFTSEDGFYKYYGQGVLDIVPTKGLKKTIELLAKSANLTIVSSTISSCIAGYLKVHGIDTYFDHILGADIEKSKHKKFLKFLSEKNLQGNGVPLVTDTLGDIREAHLVGIPSIAVTWGFHSRDTLEQGNPHALVDTPKKLLNVLKEFL